MLLTAKILQEAPRADFHPCQLRGHACAYYTQRRLGRSRLICCDLVFLGGGGGVFDTYQVRAYRVDEVPGGRMPCPAVYINDDDASDALLLLSRGWLGLEVKKFRTLIPMALLHADNALLIGEYYP